MTTRNVNTPIRSSNRNKGKNKEPQLAVPHAKAPSSELRSPLSLSRNKKLPRQQQNKTPPENVSIDPSKLNNNCHVNNSLDNLTSALSPTKEPEGIAPVLSSHHLEGGHRATQVSDNKGSSQITTTAPHSPPSGMQDPSSLQQDSDDPFHSSPNDPWHLTYTEMRAMRGRMKTLENVETATLDFAKKLQAMNDRTTITETKPNSNSEKIEAMGRDIKAVNHTTTTTETKVKSHSEKIKAMGKDFKILSDATTATEKKANSHSTKLQKMGNDIKAVNDATSTTKTKVSSNSDKIKAMGEEIASLRRTVEDQNCTIRDLQKIRDEFVTFKENTWPARNQRGFCEDQR